MLRYRSIWLSQPLLLWLSKHTAPISETERKVIEAGSVWWEKTIFQGRPDWQALLDTPHDCITDEEQAFIHHETEQLCQLVDDWKVHQNKDLSKQAWQFAKSKGFFGLNIPREFGGSEFSASAQSAIITKLATRSSALAVTVMVPNSLGPAELIHKYGSDQQKEYYLPRLAKGEEIPCFALTSEKAGSDATSIRDHAVVCEAEFEGKPCLGLRLNWSKRYITLAPVATLLGLAVKVFDPDKLLDAKQFNHKKKLGITCVLVPTHLSGVDTGQRHNPMDIPFQNGPTTGKDVFVPLDYVIGGTDMIGQGWEMLVECLVIGRALSLPALASAASQVAVYTSSGYARVRRQFGCPIGNFEGIQSSLSDLASNTYAINAVRNLTTSAIDNGARSSVVSAMIKYSTTETSRKAVNTAMDIHAGKTIIQGPRNYLSSLYKSIPISITVEGANILTRSLIIFSQGVLRCHPFLFDEFKCLEQIGVASRPQARENTTEAPADKSEPIEHRNDVIQRFDKLFFSHIRYHFSLLIRAFGYALTKGAFCRMPALSSFSKYMRHATYLSAVFGYLTDVSIIVFGDNLKRKEMLSGRFADALMMIYTVAATLKYYHAHNQPVSEHNVTRLVCEEYLYRAQSALYDIVLNLPRVLFWWTRLFMFPLGKRLPPPSDKLRKQVAKDLLTHKQLRQNLSKDLYLPTYAVLDYALQQCEKNDALLRTLAKQEKNDLLDDDEQLDNFYEQGIITAAEQQSLKDYFASVTEAIRVDSVKKL